MSNIEKPNHYQLEGLEPYESIDVIRAVLGDRVKYFYIGNILKYIIRAEKKNGLEDYKKAEVYLKWLIELEEDLKNMEQEMRKSELYNLLNKITLKFIDKESPTVREIRRLEKLTNEDLLIMDNEEMENFILGMWQGVESFIREQEDM